LPCSAAAGRTEIIKSGGWSVKIHPQPFGGEFPGFEAQSQIREIHHHPRRHRHSHLRLPVSIFSGIYDSGSATAYNLGGGQSAYFPQCSIQLVPFLAA
jgi:hypothetical protein